MIGSINVGEMAIRHVEVNVGTTQEVHTPHMTVTLELKKVAAGNAAGAAGGNAASAAEYRLTMGFVPKKAFGRAQWNDWRNMLMSFEVNLVDAEGHAFRRGRNGFAISAERFLRRAYFGADAGGAAPGEAVKATMELPCDLEEVAVPYRFENITPP